MESAIYIYIYIYIFHEVHGSVRFQTVCIDDDSVRTVRFLFIIRFRSVYIHSVRSIFVEVVNLVIVGQTRDCGANPR